MSFRGGGAPNTTPAVYRTVVTTGMDDVNTTRYASRASRNRRYIRAWAYPVPARSRFTSTTVQYGASSLGSAVWIKTSARPCPHAIGRVAFEGVNVSGTGISRVTTLDGSSAISSSRSAFENVSSRTGSPANALKTRHAALLTAQACRVDTLIRAENSVSHYSETQGDGKSI